MFGTALCDALGALQSASIDRAEALDVAGLRQLDRDEQRPVGAGTEALGGEVVRDAADAALGRARVVGEAETQRQRRDGEEEHQPEREHGRDDRTLLEEAPVVRPAATLGVVRLASCRESRVIL